jgi:hypothetical protein
MIKYKVEIHTPGRMIIFQNVSIRTPASLIATNKQLSQLKIQLNRLGITKYSVQQLNDISEEELVKLPKEIILNNEYQIDSNDQLSVPEIETLLRTGESK